MSRLALLGAALGALLLAANPPTKASARPARHRCRVPRGSHVWAHSPRAVVYANGRFANPDTHNTRVTACWRPSGRRTAVGSDFRFDEDDPTSRFALLVLAGPWLAVDQVRVNLQAASGSSPLPLISAFDLRRGAPRFCASLPVGAVVRELALRSDGVSAWIARTPGPSGAVDAVQAYDRDGVRTLATAAAGRLSGVALSAGGVNWRAAGAPGSASVVGPPRPTACPAR